MLWFIEYAQMRLLARWRSLVTLNIGVVLAAMIGANAVLYTHAIAQIGMVEALNSDQAGLAHIAIRLGLIPAQSADLGADWQSLDAGVDTIFTPYQRQFPMWIGQVASWAETQPLYAMRDGEDLAQMRLAYYEYLSDETTLQAGDYPTIVESGAVVQVVITADFAEALGLGVGDRVELDQRGWETSQIISIAISGIIAPREPDSQYWFAPDPLRIEDNGGQLRANVFTSREQLAAILPDYLPQPSLQFGWRIAFQHEELAFSQVESASALLRQMQQDFNDYFVNQGRFEGNLVYASDLPNLLQSFSERITYLNIPFNLLTLQLAVLSLFFLMLIASLVRRGEQRETAVLQSRGASDSQILLARGIEAFFICVGAAAVAPFLTRQILVAWLPLLTGNETITLEITALAWGYSFGAALIAWLLLMGSLLPMLRLPLIQGGGSMTRSATVTWWQRYYLDVVLLIVGGLALFQLTRSQTIVSADASGQLRADPLLLLAPSLLFVALSSVLLRFFPAMLRLIARFAEGRNALVGTLASWQVSREPLHYGRVALLLALAIGVGWFAISYQATLNNNQYDQAIYRTGADVQVRLTDQADPAAIRAMIGADSEIVASAFVQRIVLPSVVTGSGGRRTRQAGDLLVVNLPTLQAVTDWREDLGTLDVPVMDIPQVIGLDVPENARTITFRAYMEAIHRIDFSTNTAFHSVYPLLLMREGAIRFTFVDAAGSFHQIAAVTDTTAFEEILAQEGAFDLLRQPPNPESVLQFPDDGWLTYTVDLSLLEATAIRLVSIEFEFLGSFSVIDARFQIAQLHVDGNNPGWLGDESLEVLNRLGNAAINYQILADNGYLFELPNSQGSDLLASFRIFANYPAISTIASSAEPADDADVRGIPAVISRSFAELNTLSEGQRFSLSVGNRVVWFEVSRIADYYPTLYPERPFLIIDQAGYDYGLQRITGFVETPDELWLRLAADVNSSEFVQQKLVDQPFFASAETRDAILESYSTDIYTIGVIGLLLVAFVVGLSLSIVSLYTYISLSVQSRRAEFAVLYALGMPTRAMLRIIVIEQVLVLGAALLLGAIIGQYLTMQVLPPLAMSAAGSAVVPPFTIIVDGGAILQYLGILLLALISVLIISLLWMRSLTTTSALRLTEE